MTDKPKCDCPIMPRVENLERHMFGHTATNTHGVHPVMFGDGSEKVGIAQDIRDIKWYGKLGLWIITIIGGAILVTLGNLLAAKIAAPSPATSQAAPADAPSATTAAKGKAVDQN